MGIIGLSVSGGWAAASHLPALRTLDGFDIRALSTSNPDSARRAGEQHGLGTVGPDVTPPPATTPP
ncbi:hypothetical protein [Streptomyces sp. 2-1]|uniref:hypothetical protein n=1 Tax=Streptomyces sp. 2-1 TaxID=412710 RepID=UPI003AFA93AB